MRRFNFRLEKVLHFRRLVEDWAKDAYLDAQAKRVEAEMVHAGIVHERERLLRMGARELTDFRLLELRLGLLQEQAQQQLRIIADLRDDERAAWEAYLEKKQEAEIVEKLREKALVQWNLDMSRLEQAELDEWAVQRRAS